ncbi:hypothetical protein EON65_23970, partial [archaeon]
MDPLRTGAIFKLYSAKKESRDGVSAYQRGSMTEPRRTSNPPQIAPITNPSSSSNSSTNAPLKAIVKENFSALYRATPLPPAFQNRSQFQPANPGILSTMSSSKQLLSLFDAVHQTTNSAHTIEEGRGNYSPDYFRASPIPLSTSLAPPTLPST